MVAAAVERFGRLDGAFNNAGIEPKLKVLPEFTNGSNLTLDAHV